MTAPATAAQLLDLAIRRLGESPGVACSAGLDAQLLLAHVLTTTRASLMAQLERMPEPAQAAHFSDLIARRTAGEPLAYILGVREFWSLPLRVSAAVLVPRPETELLVERALALLSGPNGRVADLGTGSGAIALALASERPGWDLTATDVSGDALQVARHNAAALNLDRVEFLLGRWFAPLGNRRFDLLVSNPPYIGAEDPAMRDPVLKYEPVIALSPGPDAMESLTEIIQSAPAHLVSGGWLLLEHGADQGPDVARELVARGFRSVRSHRDLAGHERMTEARQP